MSLIESQRVFSGDHECTLCDSSNATSYCLHCAVKLCQSCKNVHDKLPVSRDHEVEDLKSLTAARLAASRCSPCDLHPDKIAELFCHQHKKMICLLCSSAHHRACPEVGTVGDVAVQASGEFQQQAQRLRNREGDVTTKVQPAKQPTQQQPAKQPAKQQPTQSAKQQPDKKQPQATGGGGKPTGAELARELKVGDRVTRGPEWASGDEDGGGPGTVTAVPSKIVRDRCGDPRGCVDVRWDNGREGEYLMGYCGHYELQLA